MQTVKNKLKNIWKEPLQYLYYDTNFIVSLTESKNLCRELESSRFISDLKTLENLENKCRDRRCNICQNYLNDVNKFTMPNDQVWKICREIDSNSVNVIYYLKWKICNETQTYIGKTRVGSIKGFKVTTNQHFSNCKTGILTCKLLRHVYDSSIKNNCLEEHSKYHAAIK